VSFISENISQLAQNIKDNNNDKPAPIANRSGSNELFNRIQKTKAIAKDTRMFFIFISNNLYFYIFINLDITNLKFNTILSLFTNIFNKTKTHKTKQCFIVYRFI